MSKHKQTGAKGEQIAVDFLKKQHYEIRYTNWYSGKKEVDIIATLGDLLVFVEVKTRYDFTFGFPEESVTPQKQQYLKSAADAFLEEHPTYTRIRFDIISIILQGDTVKEIKHFEDAFF